MSDTSQGQGWWLASDGKWYPPEAWIPPPPQAAQVPPVGQVPMGQIPMGQIPPMGQAPYYPPMPFAGQPTVARSTNGLSVASLVCSIAGIVPFFFGVTCILGIIFGFVSRGQIKRSHGAQGGEGLALAGIIVGFCLIGIFILFVSLVAAFGHHTCSTNNSHIIICTNN